MPIKDRITIRFSNPQVLKDLRKIAEKKQIKLKYSPTGQGSQTSHQQHHTHQPHIQK